MADHAVEKRQEDDENDVVEPTAIARKVAKLRASAMKTAETRERIPQQLFWSLFHSEIAELRSEKAQKRALRNVFLGIEE